MDQENALDAEQPRISVGKERAQRRPLFLFPHEDSGGNSPPFSEIEWKAQSVMRYHGRLPDLAHDVIDRRANSQATTLFAMSSSGVAERVTEILREYDVNPRLTSFTGETDYSSSSNVIVVAGKLSG